jgi:hypothetical protein
VYVENQIHERVEQIVDDVQEALMRLCETAPLGSARRVIMQHGDSMMNVYQLRLLISEIEDLTEELRLPIVIRLRDAADHAIKLRGYLYFVGD